MREYKVISPFSERNEKGNPTGKKASAGEVVELSDQEAKRLKAARCVIDIETETIFPAEVRVKRGRKRA
jgi:hypothetical protein